ncbi:hypothetical protein HOB10_01920 [Candidatus Parcubacteria bacterium]|jgi:hypothetical protein|nr:hypothetical protein [Candidatus Parcubacteria bacterium]
MPKMEEIILDDELTLEVDTEASSPCGFQAGDQVKPEGAEKTATVVGMAPAPDSIRADCIDRGTSLLWVRSDEGQVCFVPPDVEAHLIKVD